MIKRKKTPKAKGNNKWTTKSAKLIKENTPNVKELYPMPPVEQKEREEYQHTLNAMGFEKSALFALEISKSGCGKEGL
jgi:hypothetical protein